MSADIDAVILLGFGGPNEPAEIRPFLDRVLRGRPVPPARYDEVVEHYMRIGGRSPYNALTERQAAALARSLQARGVPIPVEIAYRNTPPYIEDAMPALLRRGITKAFAIPLTAFGGAAAADRYIGEAQAALQEHGGPELLFAPAYFEEPLFLDAHAARVRETLSANTLWPSVVTLFFSAHSVPVTTSDPYVAQLERAAQLVAARLDATNWRLAYQSRSGRPQDPWLEPDVRDALRDAGNGTTVVMSPLGFLSDHVELLYDLDVEAAAVAQSCGVELHRVPALNDHPLFIEMLADLVVHAR